MSFSEHEQPIYAGRLACLGVAAAQDHRHPGQHLVIDIGSASTELVLGQGAAIRHIESFAVGAVRHGLTFFPDGRLDAAGFEAAVRSSRSRFADTGLGARGWHAVYGACGTVRSLSEIARLSQEPEYWHVGPLTPGILDQLRAAFIDAGHVANVHQAWRAAGRVPHLPGGLALLIGLVEELGIAEVTPC